MSIPQINAKIKTTSTRQKYPTDETIRINKYVCDFEGCNKSYGKKSHLTCHWRTHTGERPFGCECGKRFTRSDELARHRRTHTGERKYTCPYCAKRFIRSDHMTKHAKRHPEFNLGEFLTARQTLGYSADPEPAALDMSASPTDEEVPKRVIFLPNNDDNKATEVQHSIKLSAFAMVDPYDTEINELSVNEGAFWHINMDLYYGYQVGEIVEVEHEPNKYWLASIYYSYKHLVLLRWIGSQEEFWVDTSSSNFLQNSSSFNLEHAQPKRLYPLGYHSQFHTRSQFDLVRPTKFLEKPTLYDPACDPYGSIHTVEDLLAHDTELNEQNCVYRNVGKMNESMDLVMANRRAKKSFGREDAEELAVALRNLDAIDAINNGDQDHVPNSATNASNNIDKIQQLNFHDSNGKDDIGNDALEAGSSKGLNDYKSLDEVNAQSNLEAKKEENKQNISGDSQVCLNEELVELCKNLIQSATTARIYNGIGENSSKVYQVKPKLLYDVGGANHERVFVPGTLVEVCHVEEHDNHLKVFQWFAVVLRNTGGRLTLRWFICDEPKFRQGRLDLKSARSEFIRDNVDQEQVQDDEYVDDKRLPADSIAFSKHFCHPSIQSVASGSMESQRNYLMPLKLRKFIEEVKGQTEADIIQCKLIDAVHDERRKSLDKDRPIIDHIIDMAQNVGPKYLKLEFERNTHTSHHEVLISSPTSSRLWRGIVMSVIKPGVYEIHSDPLPDSGEILKFVFPYDSSYTVLPVSWGSLNKDCLSIPPIRVTSPSSAKDNLETNETISIGNSSISHQEQCNHIPIVDKDQSKSSQSSSIDFEVVKHIHFINDGVTNWCTRGSDCSICNDSSYNAESTSQKEEFKCELDESSKDMVVEEFKVMDRLEVAHPSSSITICSGRIRKVVYPLLWIQISPDSYTLLPFNSTEIYPYRWSEFHGHSSISLLPMMKRINRLDDKKRKRQKVSEDSDCEQNHNGLQCRGDQDFDTTFDLGKLSDKQIDIDYILNEKSKYITIYFNHKCFTGPALSKGKICSLPQYVGPGPLRLVMEEVITKVISVAYVPPRILNDLSSRSFEELLISRKLTNTTSIEFKAKYQKRVHREVVQVCVDVNDVASYCECVCEHLKCCYNLFSPELYDGDDCPGHCRVLTKSNKFMKRATYYREKARLGEFTSDNGNKKKATAAAAAANNHSDKSARPRYVGRGSSESTNSSLSRNEQPNSRASSDEIEYEGTLTESKDNIIAEDLGRKEEETSEMVIDKGSFDNQNQLATDHMENNNIDESPATQKAKFDEVLAEQNEPPIQLQTKSVAEQFFDEFDGLAIDSDLITRWTINDLREYLKSGRMDKFVPIVMTEHIDGEALLLLDDSAIRELFQQYFTKEFTREDVDRFCHFVEYVKFRAKTDDVQTVC